MVYISLASTAVFLYIILYIFTFVHGEGNPRVSISPAKYSTAVCQFSRVQKSLKNSVTSKIFQPKKLWFFDQNLILWFFDQNFLKNNNIQTKYNFCNIIYFCIYSQHFCNLNPSIFAISIHSIFATLILVFLQP